MYILSLGFGLSIFVTAAFGGLTYFGFPGFAKNDAIERTQAQLARVEGRLIRDDILEIRREQCDAIHRDDKAVKARTLMRLERARIDFEVATGKEYELPDCDEL